MDFIKSGTIPYVFSMKNSVNFSKQMNLLSMSQGFKDSNYKILGLLVQKNLTATLQRSLKDFLNQICINFASGVEKIVKIVAKFQNFRLKNGFFKFSNKILIEKYKENCETKINFQSKRLKYSLFNKSRKLAARRIKKIFEKAYLQGFFHKFTKVLHKNRRFLQSFKEKKDFSPINSKLSKSFTGQSYSIPSKLSSKYDSMNYSVKKIKYHHGFEKL